MSNAKTWHFEMGGTLKDWPQVVCGDGPADLIARTYGAGATEHAQLIASAPALLSALQEARGLLAQVAAIKPFGQDGHAIQTRIAAAIALARGEG